MFIKIGANNDELVREKERKKNQWNYSRI
jgi:hypothetical protein